MLTVMCILAGLHAIASCEFTRFRVCHSLLLSVVQTCECGAGIKLT